MKYVIFALGAFHLITAFFLLKESTKDFQVQHRGDLVFMEIIEMPDICPGFRKKAITKFKYKNIVLSKKIGQPFCKNNKVGDVVEMRYLANQDTILFPEETIIIDLIVCAFLIFSGVYFFRIFYKLSWPWFSCRLI